MGKWEYNTAITYENSGLNKDLRKGGTPDDPYFVCLHDVRRANARLPDADRERSGLPARLHEERAGLNRTV